jgi:hypothetical protein
VASPDPLHIQPRRGVAPAERKRREPHGGIYGVSSAAGQVEAGGVGWDLRWAGRRQGRRWVRLRIGGGGIRGSSGAGVPSGDL